MREMSLSDIQGFSMSILRQVDLFCRDNDIAYSLGYGALIGAIRHKDFIPWDDDIDLIMTRPNYMKFVQLFNQDKGNIDWGLKLYAPELGNSFFNITHICDMNKTRVRKYYQWTDEETGLWLDVFPLDSLPADNGEKMREQSSICYNVCGSKVPFSREFDLERHLKIIRKKILYGRYDRQVEIKKYLTMIDHLPKYGETEYVCNVASPYGIKDIHKRNIFNDYLRAPFGEMEVSIISEFDTYLCALYGDYMQLPPLSARVRSHAVNRYFWK